MARYNPYQTERNGHHHHQRGPERLEPAYNEKIYDHQHDGKRCTQISEYLKSDLPFTVPLH